jgi:endonuclease/exonuclease/phosphatase (EEP) superfamily protein YafD
LLVPIWAGLLGLLALVIARVVAFDDQRALMLTNAYTPWVYLPAYFVAAAAICFRAKTLAIVAAMVVACHLAWVLPPVFRVVSVPAAAATAPHVRVVSSNLMFDNPDVAPLLAEISRFNGDIIVLEELTPTWWAAVQASGLLVSHPHHLEQTRTGAGGMALLSKLPFRDSAIRYADGVPVLTATVVVRGEPLSIVGVHVVAPNNDFARNGRQQQLVNRVILRTSRPRVVAGDFNSTPYNKWYEELRGLGLREAHEGVGKPFATTWPNGRRPLIPVRLDHVFADRSVLPLAVQDGRGEGSDHRPVVADFAIMPSSAL